MRGFAMGRDSERRDPGVVINEEKRSAPRVEYEVEVDYRSEDNFYTGFIKNISSGGLFLYTHEPLPIGSEINVRFTIPNFPQPIVARALVRWIRPYRQDTQDSVPGMGVQFLSIDPPEAVAAINDFIQRRREPEFFEV